MMTIDRFVDLLKTHKIVVQHMSTKFECNFFKKVLSNLSCRQSTACNDDNSKMMTIDRFVDLLKTHKIVVQHMSTKFECNFVKKVLSNLSCRQSTACNDDNSKMMTIDRFVDG